MKKTKLLACALCAMSLTAAAAGAANTVTAVPTRETGQTVYLNVTNRFDEDCYTRVYPTAYNIGGNNYFKLRDLAALVGFKVEWDEASKSILIDPRKIGDSDTSLQDNATTTVQATPSTAVCLVGTLHGDTIRYESAPQILQSYNIGGNNYVKLRDIAETVGFEINFDAANKKVEVYKAMGFGYYAQSSAAQTAQNSNEYVAGHSTVQPTKTGNNNNSPANMKDVNGFLVPEGATVKEVNGIFVVDFSEPNVGMATNQVGNNAAAANASIGTTSQSIATANTSTTAQRELTPIPDELYDKLVEASLKYVNEERAKVGSAPLQHNPLLTKSARWWAEQMASTGDFRHTTQDDLRRMEQEYGIDGIYATGAKAAENCAITPVLSNYSYTQTFGDTGLAILTEENVDETAKKVVAQYVNSPAHYKIMTDAEYNSVEFIGFGFALFGNGLYSVQQYGDDRISRGVSPFWSKFPNGTIEVFVKVENGKTIYYNPIVSTSDWGQSTYIGTGEIMEYTFD